MKVIVNQTDPDSPPQVDYMVVLFSTERANLWPTSKKIDLPVVDRALIELPRHGPNSLLNRGFSASCPIEPDALVHELERHYLARAWEQSRHNKVAASKLVGFNSANTFRNRCTAAGVDIKGPIGADPATIKGVPRAPQDLN